MCNILESPRVPSFTSVYLSAVVLGLGPRVPPTGHVVGTSLRLNSFYQYHVIDLYFKAAVQSKGEPESMARWGYLGPEAENHCLSTLPISTVCWIQAT